MIQAARPKTAGSWLVEQLRDAVIRGTLPAGSAIRQEELARTYGVSRMPVRQALEALAAEGWIELRPHRGAVVATLDPEDALELFEVRAALEALAIRRSFPRLSAAQHGEIDRAWRALRAGRADRFTLHRQFHLTLYAAAGGRLIRLITQHLDAAQRYLRFESTTLHVSDDDNEEHALLVAAAERRDVEAGTQLINSHITGGGEAIAESLRRRGEA